MTDWSIYSSDVEQPCVSCGEPTHNANPVECRDCNIERLLAEMECPNCKRMRYRADDVSGLAQSLWGDRCECPKEQG